MVIVNHNNSIIGIKTVYIFKPSGSKLIKQWRAGGVLAVLGVGERAYSIMFGRGYNLLTSKIKKIYTSRLSTCFRNLKTKVSMLCDSLTYNGSVFQMLGPLYNKLFKEVFNRLIAGRKLSICLVLCS